MSRFRSLVLDVDSTLSGIEGVDWLAARRDPEVAAECASLTAQVMAGELPLEAVYARRLSHVRPSAADLAALAVAYQEAVAPGARDLVRRLAALGVEIQVVSGGLREAILPFADWLGLTPGKVHAVGIRLDPSGSYLGFESANPLARSGGKAVVVRALGLPGPVLAVGDGATDLELRSAGATFAAFTGFVRREAVVRGADHVIDTFDQLQRLVLP